MTLRRLLFRMGLLVRRRVDAVGRQCARVRALPPWAVEVRTLHSGAGAIAPFVFVWLIRMVLADPPAAAVTGGHRSRRRNLPEVLRQAHVHVGACVDPRRQDLAVAPLAAMSNLLALDLRPIGAELDPDEIARAQAGLRKRTHLAHVSDVVAFDRHIADGAAPWWRARREIAGRHSFLSKAPKSGIGSLTVNDMVPGFGGIPSDGNAIASTAMCSVVPASSLRTLPIAVSMSATDTFFNLSTPVKDNVARSIAWSRALFSPLCANFWRP